MPLCIEPECEEPCEGKAVRCPSHRAFQIANQRADAILRMQRDRRKKGICIACVEPGELVNRIVNGVSTLTRLAYCERHGKKRRKTPLGNCPRDVNGLRIITRAAYATSPERHRQNPQLG